jgi:hypothetical protein
MSCSSRFARRVESLLRALALSVLACIGAGALAAEPAAPAEVMAALPQARLVGSATMRFIGLRVYDVRLWAGSRFDAGRYDAAPFALELHYARALVGARIAERSLDEMRRAGGIDDATAQRWVDAMTRAFPDVAPGDRLVGLHAPGGPTRFLHNGRPTASIDGADFARRFFGIWLADTTSEPALRERLTAGAPR